jgi:trimeric autotransporter adhesin
MHERLKEETKDQLMEPSTEIKTITPALVIGFALACAALPPCAQAVTPAPDGGYPGFNTAEGQNALFSRTTAVWNTALGAFTLFGDTTGNGNTAVGINGLRNNVTGEFNTAVGLNALYFNNGNPANLEASFNSAFGTYALFHNTTGFQNCAFGAYALFSNNTGPYNTAFGESALLSNTTGYSNTAIGAYTLENNTGSLNTAVGVNALGTNGNGTQNTATGASVLTSNTIGNSNTAMGHHALLSNDTGGNNTAIGVGALGANTSGGANTALGFGAGANVTTGSFNVYIGTDVGGVTNEVGHTYVSNISSTVQPPGGNVEYVTINLDTKLLGHSSSSRRYKEDIKPMTNASDALYRLKPVTYRYRKEIDPNQAAAFGLIAEEVGEVNPALVARNPKGQPESVHYEMVNAMLLNEFLKEHKKVEEQACEIHEQKATIGELKEGMEVLTTQLRDQAGQIQKVSAQVELTKPAPQMVASDP